MRLFKSRGIEIEDKQLEDVILNSKCIYKPIKHEKLKKDEDITGNTLENQTKLFIIVFFLVNDYLWPISWATVKKLPYPVSSNKEPPIVLQTPHRDASPGNQE